MSQTNAMLGAAFLDPNVICATIDPMGMVKAHRGAMPVYAGTAQRWASSPGGTAESLGLSELGGTPGFEAGNALIMNPHYQGPALQLPPGTIRTTAMIQAEARLAEAMVLAKAQNGRPGAHPVDAAAALGLPPQPETQAPEEGSAINRPTPVEGLVGFKMEPRTPMLTPGPIGKFPTAAEIEAAAKAAAGPVETVPAPAPLSTRVDPLAELLKADPEQMPVREILRSLILALDLGFNGNQDLKKMRAAVASMADGVRKGIL
ncbi:MAG TPA: hypothetical protein PLS53_00155 [Thermoanaerobaculaceae bacterium]|nr:hypothetical protein [Thermoanaerobaculaceae bacterium]